MIDNNEDKMAQEAEGCDTDEAIGEGGMTNPTIEEALDMAARMDESGDYYRSNVSGGMPMAMYLEDAARIIRALVAERDEAESKLALAEKTIQEAGHGMECDKHNWDWESYSFRDDKSCTCWKADYETAKGATHE